MVVPTLSGTSVLYYLLCLLSTESLTILRMYIQLRTGTWANFTQGAPFICRWRHARSLPSYRSRKVSRLKWRSYGGGVSGKKRICSNPWADQVEIPSLSLSPRFTLLKVPLPAPDRLGEVEHAKPGYLGTLYSGISPSLHTSHRKLILRYSLACCF